MKYLLLLLILISKPVSGLTPTEEEIVRDEGVVFHTYKDSLGFLTGGIGHRLTEEETKAFPVGTSLSDNQVTAWFRTDMAIAVKCAETLAPYAPLDVKPILVNMAFNLGCRGLSKFEKMLGYVDEEKYQEAAKEMANSLWAKQLPNRAGRLIKRMWNIRPYWGRFKANQSERFWSICRIGHNNWRQAGKCKHADRHYL